MHEGARKQKSMRQSNQKPVQPYRHHAATPHRRRVATSNRLPPWHVATLHPPAKQAGRSGGETEWPHRGMSMTACGVTRRHCDNASACRIAAWRRRNATSKANNMAACSITARRANGKAAKPACHRHNATTWHIIAIPSYAPSPYRQHVALPRDPSRNEAACEKGAEPCGTHCAAQSGRATWDVRGQRGREP